MVISAIAGEDWSCSYGRIYEPCQLTMDFEEAKRLINDLEEAIKTSKDRGLMKGTANYRPVCLKLDFT